MPEVAGNFCLPKGNQLFSFAIVAVSWLLAGAVLSLGMEFYLGKSQLLLCLGTFLGLWTLCIVDLLAQGRLLSIIFKWMRSPSENRVTFYLQVLSWGGLKLVCLGLFFITLLKGQKLPLSGLLLGMGTLAVVPVMGGFFWNQKVQKHA